MGWDAQGSYLFDWINSIRSHNLKPMMEVAREHFRPAGQRVQIIKLDEKGRGKLQFGTEVIKTADCSLAALLGASPGTSVSVSAMLNVIESCLPELVQGESRQRLEELITSIALLACSIAASMYALA
jgi:malate dehydrogenase (quinone)